MAADTTGMPQGLQMSAVEIQQEFYEAIGDADWELYERQERKYLLQKIGIALFGPPKIEGNLTEGGDQLKLKGYEKREEELTMTVFEKICEQAKYSHNNVNILISVIRVVCVFPKEEVPFFKPEPEDYWLDLHQKAGDGVSICVFHVFAIRKCVASKGKTCRIFIDHEGRLYKNWEAFLTENHLPKSVMVVPTNGEYKAMILPDGSIATVEDDPQTPRVSLTVLASPALGIKARILSTADTINTVASVSALLGVGVGVATLPLLPVVAPVALGLAGGVAAVTGVYGIFRSSLHLADRGQHDQPIGLDNAEARGSWLNLTLSTVGLSFSAAGKLLSLAAATGTDVKFYKYDETPTKLELFQFTTAALFFGLGAMSNQTAEAIVQDAQARTINEHRDGLSSNVKRKMFDKATAETRRLKGTVQGNADIIKALNKIENKDDFFAALNRANKDMNKNKVRVSLSPDGKAIFNNAHKLDVNEIGNMGRADRQQLFSKYGPAKVTTKNAATRIYASTVSGPGTSNASTTDFSIYIRPEEILKIATMMLKLTQIDQEYLAEILSQLTADVHEAFLLICADLFLNLVPDELLKLTGLGQHQVIRVIYFVFNHIQSKIPTGLYHHEHDNSLRTIVNEFFRDGRISKETLLQLKKKFMQWISLGEVSNTVMMDDLSKFKTLFDVKYRVLEAGKVMKIGEHEVLIKEATVALLSERFVEESQEKCDMFVNFCLSIIAELSKGEVAKLSLLNPDVDLLMIVAKYLKAECPVVDVYIGDFVEDGVVNTYVVRCMKNELLKWLEIVSKRLRQHKVCKLCLGLCYA
ncbi:uncharacterized protein LOC105384324 isoform X2 [Plutella xylostella]|uniref:uncharacterized protein LOC105384324 isoform X2 n=1 Tax=Plutella xylostella TaxID=51655 RepID=UPI00203275F6|nr:uncharacterized protein LOC105384324 isoform X2 [Plutella xylostella]